MSIWPPQGMVQENHREGKSYACRIESNCECDDEQRDQHWVLDHIGASISERKPKHYAQGC